MTNIWQDRSHEPSSPAPSKEKATPSFVIALALAALSFFIRIFWIDHPALWKDEIFSLVYTWHSYGHHFDLHRVTDIHPPLYPVMLKLWISMIGDGRAEIRSLSVLFGAATVIPLYFVVLRFTSPRTAFLSALFLVVNPINIHFSRELRNYSMLSFFLMLATLFFVYISSRPDSRPNRLNVVLFSFALALCFCTHYVAVLFFVLFGLAAIALFLEDRDVDAFKLRITGILLAGLLCIPQSIHMFGYSLSGGAERNDWISKTTPLIFYQQTLAAFPYPAFLKPVMAAAYAFGAWNLYRRSLFLFTLTITFTGFAFILCAFVGIFKGIYLVRSIQCFVLFSGVLLAEAISTLSSRQMLFAAAGLVAINLWSARLDYPPRQIRDPGTAFRYELMSNRPQAVYYDADLEYYMRALKVDVRGWQALRLDRVTEGSKSVNDHLIRCHATGKSCGTTGLMIAFRPPFFQADALEWNKRADGWKRIYGTRIDKVADGFRLVVFN